MTTPELPLASVNYGSNGDYHVASRRARSRHRSSSPNGQNQKFAILKTSPVSRRSRLAIDLKVKEYNLKPTQAANRRRVPRGHHQIFLWAMTIIEFTSMRKASAALVKARRNQAWWIVASLLTGAMVSVSLPALGASEGGKLDDLDAL
ncbi:MAG: hypothetical protein JWO52_7137 [Gammaproteobacteria bacterium]|nr:hypothetical protein [Gammaproteobacteria bacterium]